MAHSNVIDHFKRCAPGPEDIPKDPLPVMSRRHYDALAAEPTEKAIDDIKAPIRSYKVCSGIGKLVIPSVVSLVIAVEQHSVAIDDLPMAWLSLLPCPKDVVRRKSTGETFLVQQTSKSGFCGVPVKFVKVGSDVRIVQFVGKGLQTFPRWTAIVNAAHWESLAISISPPIEVRAKGHPAALGLVMGEAVGLVVRCAQRGFAHVPNPFVDRLYRTEVRRKNPAAPVVKVFTERLVLLIKAVIPGITDAGLSEAFSARTPKQASKTLLSIESELCDSTLDSSDKAELRAAMAQHRRGADAIEKHR
jgi:hypothetical protein